MNDADFQTLAGLGRAIGTSAPEHAEWKWDASARVALAVLTVEEVGRLCSALAETCEHDWTVENVGECSEDVGIMIREMGDLRPGQHLFCSGMGAGDFVYLAVWPWNDQAHVSVRFGLYYATGRHDDSAVHNGVIKRGLGIGSS